MATTNFSAKALNEHYKRSFTTTLFHDGDTWKVQSYNALENGAVSSSASATADASPVLRVQRIVNGQPVGPIERLFISSLYMEDESAEGIVVPHTGAINAIVKRDWDNPTLVSDAQAVQAVINSIYGVHPDGIITCHRKLEKDAQGNPLKKITFRGDLRPIVSINWD